MYQPQQPISMHRDCSSVLDTRKCGRLPAESEDGNVEYKLRLTNPTPSRLQHLVTQLKWRLAQGAGEALYQLGVADNGALVGLSDADLQASLETLGQMARALGAEVSILRRVCVSDNRHVVEVECLPTYLKSMLRACNLLSCNELHTAHS